MKYAVSDLHGRYDKYTEMLERINFTDADELYILGDICDRGPKAAQIYLDIMKRKNIHCIKGNHEQMLLALLPTSFRFLLKKQSDFGLIDFKLWGTAGGVNTCVSLIEVGYQNIVGIYDYISLFPIYRIVVVNDKRYLLLHAGLHNYAPMKNLNDYLPKELVWYDIDYEDTYY